MLIVNKYTTVLENFQILFFFFGTVVQFLFVFIIGFLTPPKLMVFLYSKRLLDCNYILQAYAVSVCNILYNVTDTLTLSSRLALNDKLQISSV